MAWRSLSSVINLAIAETNARTDHQDMSSAWCPSEAPAKRLHNYGVQHKSGHMSHNFWPYVLSGHTDMLGGKRGASGVALIPLDSSDFIRRHVILHRNV